MSFIETPGPVMVPELAKRGLRQRLRVHTDAYPRSIWALSAAVLTVWTGRGMVLPFLVIYFSQIAGIRASVVGAVIAGSGLAGIAFVLIVAGQIDKRGGRPVLLATLSMISLATLLIAWANSTPAFLAVSLLLYCASQSYWPSIDTVVTSLADAGKVIPAMALIRVAMAVGIGLGGLLGGIMVAGGGLSEYRLLFGASAALIALGAVIVWRVVPSVPLQTTSDSGAQGTWGDVLADRTFLYGMLVLFALVLGFTQLNMSVPPFLRAEAGIGEGRIGALFFMNTILIVLTQVPIAARVDRGNVGRLLSVASLIWGAAFLAMIATPGFSAAAIFVFLAFTGGELIFLPITAIIAVRLAPLHLRGRYFSLLSITWGGSWAIATLTAGIALDLSRPVLLWPVMAAFMVVGAVAAWRLRSIERLTPPVIAQTGTADG
ncbi:MFS transporter [soil metagenome]